MIVTLETLIDNTLDKFGGLKAASKDPVFYDAKRELRRVLYKHRPVMIQLLPTSCTVALPGGAVVRAKG